MYKSNNNWKRTESWPLYHPFYKMHSRTVTGFGSGRSNPSRWQNEQDLGWWEEGIEGLHWMLGVRKTHRNSWDRTLRDCSTAYLFTQALRDTGNLPTKLLTKANSITNPRKDQRSPVNPVVLPHFRSPGLLNGQTIAAGFEPRPHFPNFSQQWKSFTDKQKGWYYQ